MTSVITPQIAAIKYYYGLMCFKGPFLFVSDYDLGQFLTAIASNKGRQATKSRKLYT